MIQHKLSQLPAGDERAVSDVLKPVATIFPNIVLAHTWEAAT